MIHSINSDATKAVITVAAQRIAATCDKHGITLAQNLCEEVAELVLLDYRAFFAGVSFAQAHNPIVDAADHPTRTASTLPQDLHGLTYEQATPEQIARTREHMRAQVAAPSTEPNPSTAEPNRTTGDGPSPAEPDQ